MRTDSVTILMKEIALEIEKLSNQVLAPYELSNTQYRIMMMLYNNQVKAVRQVDIEKRLLLTNPTVTAIIQNLEKKGLVQRTQNPEDRRSKFVVLTDKAVTMREQISPLGKILEAQVTENLTKEEREQLICLLRKMRSKGGHKWQK